MFFALAQNVCAQDKSAIGRLDFSKKGISKKHINSAKKAQNLSIKYDSVWFASLDRIAVIYYLRESMDTFKIYSDLYFQSALSVNRGYEIGNGHYNLGSYYLHVSQSDSAYYHFYCAQKHFKEIGDSLKVSENLLNLAIVDLSVSDYSSCENLSIEALEFLPQKGSLRTRTSLFNNLGIVYSELGDFKESIKWYRKSLELAQSSKEKLTLNNNIGVVYRKQKSYENALMFFNVALSVEGIEDIPMYQAMVMDNLGYTDFLRKGDGYSLMNQSLLMRRSQKNVYGEVVSSLHLADYFYSKGQRKDALDLLENTLKQAKKIGNIKNQLKVLLALGEQSGNSIYFIEHNIIQDSVLQAERKLKNRFASIRFETKQKEIRNLELQAENGKKERNLAIEKTNNAYLLIALISILALIIPLILYLRQRKKAMEYQASLDTLKAKIGEQDRISLRLHHDIANDLLKSIRESDKLNATIRNDKFETIIDELEVVYDKTVHISHHIGTLHFRKVSFEKNIESMCHSFEKTSEFKIIIVGLENIDWIHFETEILYEIYLSIKELLSNVQKYAGASVATLTFSHKSDVLFVVLSDNGNGFNKDVTSGIGLDTIEGKITELQGDFIIHSSSNGTRVEFNVPCKMKEA